jgi:hypothetical protein
MNLSINGVELKLLSLNSHPRKEEKLNYRMILLLMRWERNERLFQNGLL